MQLNDTEREYPNFDYGYETTIKMPFHFSRLSNGSLTVHDEGPKYDMYSCKGSMVILPELLNYVGAFGYTPDNRGGLSFMRDTATKGFYPFTPAVFGTRVILEGGQVIDYDDLFFVAFSKVDLKGKVDIFARAFRVDLEMFMVKRNESYSLIFAGAAPTQPEGELVISGNGIMISGIRHPVNGFNPSKGYNAYPRQMLGRRYESVNYRFMQDYEPRASSLTITATAQTAASIIRALLNDIRANWFRIQAPQNYAVFGGADNGDFTVRLSSGELRVKHTRFDEFEIGLNVELRSNRG